MRLLFLSHYFPPEVNAPANRTYEHCREWVRSGHEVHVVTCIPSHPHGQPFPGFRRRWYQHDLVDGIHVHRVWTYLAANRGVGRRTLNYLSFVPTAVGRALWLGSFDVAIGTSPQFFCAAATGVYGRLRGVPWVFEVRDLWPESIPAVGAMTPSAAIRMLSRFEMHLYKQAAATVCVTESFVRALRARGVDPDRLHYVPNGINPEFWCSADRQAERHALGIGANEILASYVGTVGMAHGLDVVLAAASRLRVTAPTIRIAITGDGAELEGLRAIAARDGLTNVSFTGLVPHDRIPGILAASDIALVTLKPADVFKTVLPSKMFEAMAARRPIALAVAGEARAILERAGAGIATPPGDAAALAGALTALAADSSARATMGDSGARFVAAEFSRRVWADRYMTLLESLAIRGSVRTAAGHVGCAR